MIIADMDGKNVYQTELPKEAILVMGNEANGVSTNIINLVGNKVAEGTDIIAVEKLEAGIYLLKIDNNLFKIIKE